MSLDLTSFSDAFKRLYTPQRLESMAYKRNPLHAMFGKNMGFYGDSMPIPIVYANPQSRSADVATAIAAAPNASSQIKAFLLTRAKDYGVINIDNETMEASENDRGAFMAARKVEVDGILNSVIRSLAIAEYRLGYGLIGKVSAISTATITLTNPRDITNIEKGQVHVFAATESASALRNTGGTTTLTVLSVNRTAGTVTYTAAVSTVTGTTTGDSIFCNGDRQDSASPTKRKVSGLLGWLPTTAPTSGDSFFGVDRSLDTRLGGLRQTATGSSIEEALTDAAALCFQEGGAPDKCFVNYLIWAQLEKSLQSRGVLQMAELKVTPTIGFPAIRVMGPGGPIDVVADQNCPTGIGMMLQMDRWKFWSLKGAPRVFNSDTLEMLRLSTSDGVELRAGYYGNLACDAPGYNCNIAFV